MNTNYFMWSSKSLNILYIPFPELFAVPSLLPHDIPSGAGRKIIHEFFWPINIEFGMWITRLVKKAESLKQNLDERERIAYEKIKLILDEQDILPHVKEFSEKSGEIKLNIHMFYADCAYSGDVPMFEGIEKVRPANETRP